jgi:hypothetical protein
LSFRTLVEELNKKWGHTYLTVDDYGFTEEDLLLDFPPGYDKVEEKKGEK